jgi:hypothetical protein
MKTTDIFNYLNKLGLADQVHLRNNEQIIFYHWNVTSSELLISLVVQANRIEKISYKRSNYPKIYAMANAEIENDFDLNIHKYVRDKRGD